MILGSMVIRRKGIQVIKKNKFLSIRIYTFFKEIYNIILLRIVLSLLYNQIPNLPKPLRNVHQLDHATSGCYCLALTKKSAGIASIAFAKREVDKYYLAIVRGWMKNDR
jgi:23S rRNA-/tRNA-specific pseudouridylate synthase